MHLVLDAEEQHFRFFAIKTSQFQTDTRPAGYAHRYSVSLAEYQVVIKFSFILVVVALFTVLWRHVPGTTMRADHLIAYGKDDQPPS